MNKTNDLPEKLSKPAQRALAAQGIGSLKDITKYTEAEIAALHGVGPTAVVKL